MASGKEIPWSAKPKNGIKTFFTEETFNKWIGQDTHESRIEERLHKVGISTSARLTGPLFLNTPKPECKSNQKIDVGIRCSESSLRRDDTIKWPSMSMANAEVKEELSAQQSQINSSNIQADKFIEQGGSCKKRDKQLQKFEASSADITGRIDYTSQPTVEVLCAKEQEYIWDTDANADGKKVGNQGRNDVTSLKEMTKTKVNEKNVMDEFGLDMQELTESVLESKDVETESLVRPISFYKEGSEEKPQAETLEDENSKHLSTGNEGPKTTGPSGHETRSQTNFKRCMSEIKNCRQEKAELLGSEEFDSKKSEAAIKEEDARQEEEARKTQKQLLIQDKMFFNLKDRTAEKYFPDVFKKRPKNRQSKLTCQEQRLYLDLVRRFGNLDANTAEIHDENFKKYIEMKVIVSKEQELFQKYLKSISHTCKKDYEYIHPEVEKYAAARYLVKKKECFKYPRFYNSVSKIVLTDAVPDNPPTLHYIRPLLELGSVSKLVLPSVLPGMPQPCVTTNFKKINDICPIVKGVYTGTYVWNKMVCSQDPNAEQLAVPNKCDIVMSSSAIKCLVDNQGRTFKYWDMPFTVREYKINEGEKTTIHKVIYIDKPVTRQSQYVPKDQIQLYQKHAIRACAVRSNVRGHVFCGIKPVHELVKMPTLEEIQHEVNDYEGKLKEFVNKDSVLDSDSEDDSAGPKALKKRKRKHGQMDVFDLEKDIDELETFGMDSFIVSKGKTDGDKGIGSEKLKSSTEKADAFGRVVKKGRKSAEDDLQSLKNELESIKTKAVKESFKHAEILRDIDSKENGKGNKAAVSVHTAENDEVNSCSRYTKENTENTRSKENDSISMLPHEKDTTNIAVASADTRKIKKDMINVKSLSSLSEKMKQMSTIKSKLMQRMKGQGMTTHALSSDVASAAQFESGEDGVWSNKFSRDTHSEIKSTVKNLNGTGVDESEPEQKMIETASDSDSEGEGLVIDVLSGSPADHAGSTKHSVRNTRYDKTEMATLENDFNDFTNKVAAKEKTEAELKSECDEDKTIKAENEVFDTFSLVIAGGEFEEITGKEKMKGGKRRNTAEASVEVLAPKRILRSAANRKYVTDNTRNTVTVKEKPDTDPVPVKQGRGRPRKKLAKTENKTNIAIQQENNTLKMSKNVSEKQNSAQIEDENNDNSEGLVDIKIQDVEDDEEHPENKDADSDINCDEEFPHMRKRSNVRRIDSDDETEEMHHENSISAAMTKELKKDWSELEARKIKEMAEAMKNKIEETKRKIREEKCKKINQSRKSDSESSSEKVCNLSAVSQKTVHSQDISAVDSKFSQMSEGNLKSEEKRNVESGLDQGLESILKLQDKMHGPCVNKGSLAEMFTQKHGMTHCGFPVDDNVTYHQWNLNGINVLIRSKYHGFISGQGLVHISPKIEYQPNFGFEQDTVNEMCRNWISVYIRPNSSLLKPRINPFNSEIMMFDYVAYKDLVPPDSLFKPPQAFTDLYAILDRLKSLPVGQYLLKNNPRKDQFTVLKAAEQEERGSFDLHLHHCSFIKCNSPPFVQWTPLDTTLMLPHQRKMSFIPCTYQPKDARIVEKKQEKNKKKRKRRNRDNQ